MVRLNIKRVRKVWRRLGKFLIREGADPRVAKFFYRAVTQAVLLFGLETWVIFAAMERMVDGTHTGFLRQIMGKRDWQNTYRTWVNPRAEVVQEAVGTQSAMTYIGRIQGTVAQWVALHPIFEVCAREAGYEGGGCRRVALWRQDAAETQIRETLEEILRETRLR